MTPLHARQELHEAGRSHRSRGTSRPDQDVGVGGTSCALLCVPEAAVDPGGFRVWCMHWHCCCAMCDPLLDGYSIVLLDGVLCSFAKHVFSRSLLLFSRCCVLFLYPVRVLINNLQRKLFAHSINKCNYIRKISCTFS